MREDMFKVIVERPRWSGETTSRSRRFRDGEARPGRIGMKQGYDRRKWLNENLAPLRRWLVSQAGRPWNAVYAELCANIDRRNTVQEHIFAHIDDIVERETSMVEGRVHAMTWGRRRVRGSWPRGLAPVEELFAELYVHPGNGLLLRNVHRPSFGTQWWIYARCKRQLSSAELREHQLTNDHAGHPRRGRWWSSTRGAVGGLGVRSCNRTWCCRPPLRSGGRSSSGVLDGRI